MKWLPPWLLVIAACCGTACTGVQDGPGFEDDDLADFGALVDRPYALLLDSLTVRCEKDASGNCANDDEQHNRVTAIGVLDLTGAESPFQLCHFELDADGNELSMADRSAMRVPSGAVRAGLSAEGALEVQLAIVMGAELDDAFSDALPYDGKQPGVVDHDGDGQVGMTLDPPGPGEIFMSSRVSVAFSGVDPAADDLDVAAESSYEQVIYDDTIPFVNARKRAQETQESTVVKRREALVTLLGSEASCAAALDAAGSR